MDPFQKRVEGIQTYAEEHPEGDLEAQFDKPEEGYVDRQDDSTDIPTDPYARPDYKKDEE